MKMINSQKVCDEVEESFCVNKIQREELELKAPCSVPAFSFMTGITVNRKVKDCALIYMYFNFFGTSYYSGFEGVSVMCSL